MKKRSLKRHQEENEEDEEAPPPSRRPRKPRNPDQKPPKCRPRIDQLAMPTKMRILFLYQDHAHVLPRDKVEKLKALLQELYAMTPEETEKYFEHLRKQAAEAARRKDIKFMLRKLVKKKKKAKEVREAYEFVRRLLQGGMEYASKHAVPPLVSVRLRNLSNIILQQICNLRNVNVPSREDPEDRSSFLIRVADWMAIAIEHVYYGVQLKKNKELEKIENEAKAREALEKKSTPQSPTIEEELSEGQEEDPIITEPLSVPEME